jgi:lysine/ornithine N-monooxygenase
MRCAETSGDQKLRCREVSAVRQPGCGQTSADQKHVKRNFLKQSKIAVIVWATAYHRARNICLLEKCK